MPWSAETNTDLPLEPDGHAWLRDRLELEVRPPIRASSARRADAPRSKAARHDPIAHVKFALRHEPTDLTVLVAALRRTPATDLEAWVAREPTGAFARRAWFLYETFVGDTLDLPDAIVGNYQVESSPS